MSRHRVFGPPLTIPVPQKTWILGIAVPVCRDLSHRKDRSIRTCCRTGQSKTRHRGLGDSRPHPVTVLCMSDALSRLRRLNIIAMLLHTLQAAAVVMLANDFALPVAARYMNGPPGSAQSELVTVSELRTAWIVAAFLALSAVAHFLIAFPLRSRYETWLAARTNPARWVEYSLSSTLMIIVILQLCGIDDLAALISAALANVAMILFGWLQEKYEEPGTGMMPFWFGCIAGSAPWVAIGAYLFSPGSSSAANPPGFVYGIIISLFLFFNCFALNQWLQYKEVGKWREYLYGERAYLILSLAAKSALAWQVFGGTLAG